MMKIFCSAILLCMVSLSVSAQNGRTIKLFNEGWKFYKGDIAKAESPGFDDKQWREITLPHDWSVEGPFSKEWASGTGYLPGGIGWYRKSFDMSEIGANGKFFIYFDGVYKNSEVWINGKYLGKRPNGYASFQYEIGPHLIKGKNVIAVKADHTQFADSRWYPGSGIYRNVYIINTNPVFMPTWGVRFTTPRISDGQAKADVRFSVNNTLPSNATIKAKVSLLFGQEQVASEQKDITVEGKGSGNENVSLSVNQPKLWSPDAPHLYTLSVELIQNGKLIDKHSEQVGFRTIRFDAQEGFFLNGKNLKMKGVCIHHDAGALGAAVPVEVWQRRLKKLKELGCNAIRMSHYPHQDYIYRLCDEMGFLVIDEAFDEWEVGKNKWIEGWNVGTPGKDGYHEHFAEWAERDLRDMILRNINRPSIVMWSIGNEIDYPNDPYTHEVLNTGRNPQIYGKGYLPDHPPASRLGEISKRLADVVRGTDSTRPVTAALAGVVMSNTTTYPDNLDVVGYNYQEYRYKEDHEEYPKRIIYGSENGKGTEGWVAVDTSRNIFGQFLWTAYDFLGEARAWPVRSSGAGLLDLAGFPKTEYYHRASLWLDTPIVYLTAAKITPGQQGRGGFGSKASWNWQAGDKMRVYCISNLDESELFLNGRSLGKRRKDQNEGRLFWELDYQAGELEVKGYRDGKEVANRMLKTAGPAKQIKAGADMTTFVTGKKQVAHVEIELTDAQGNLVTEAVHEISVHIKGNARLLGLESGDLASHEDYKASRRKTFNGRLLAYVETTGLPGLVTVTLSSPGLKPATLRLDSTK